MNTQSISNSIKVAVLVTTLSCGANLHANTIAPNALTLTGAQASQSQFATIRFSDSAEAGMLHRAYFTLASGDHDYKGHRVNAMHEIEAAAKLLGLDLSGTDKDREPQRLSDEKLRETKGLIEHVLGASEVKDQKHVTKHLKEAINQINKALTDR